MAPSRPPLTVVVLAAGMGTRMRSERIKLLHPVAGRPMVDWVVDAAASLKPSRMVAVVGHQAPDVEAAIGDRCTDMVLQKEQRGTGHAVLQALKKMKPADADGTLLILNGDLPTLRASTLRDLLRRHHRSGAALTLLTAKLDDATGYGRILRGPDGGGIRRIVEHRDASPAERSVPEVNIGIYCGDASTLLPILRKLRPTNAQGEYYLTDAVHALIDRGAKVKAVCHDDAEEVLGVNTRAELARANGTVYARKADALMESGVTLLDPARTWVDPRARIGRDTILYPDVLIEGPVVIGANCTVYPGCRIQNSRVGRGAVIKDRSVILESVVGDDAAVGPFAHLRPGTRLDTGAKVGNFVEVKKARLRTGVKASHLSYIGDADIGAGSNIGAGTITCNYDGKNKWPTTLGREVFIGSDSQLIAPVTVGDGAYVGAGSTITKDVPAGALAVGRGRQTNIEGWVDRKKREKRKKRG